MTLLHLYRILDQFLWVQIVPDTHMAVAKEYLADIEAWTLKEGLKEGKQILEPTRTGLLGTNDAGCPSPPGSHIYELSTFELPRVVQW